MDEVNLKKRVVLVSLITFAGLLSSASSIQFVETLNNEEVVEMISALSNKDLQPAQFVAAVTGPGGLKEIKNPPQDSSEKEINS